MSTETKPVKTPSLEKIIVSILATTVFLGIVLFGALAALTPAGQTVIQWMKTLFALDSVQLWWYVTRASGIVAYLLLWLSTVLGLAVKSKYLDWALDRLFSYDFHEFISLLSIAFVVLHIGVLLIDRYLPYTIWQILVPFLSPYRPFWVGIGVIGFYVTLLVTITFYLRNRIGPKAFRAIHVLSLAGYLGVTLHGFFAGTDSPLPAMKILYIGTGLVVVFLTVYWLVLHWQQSREKAQAQLKARRVAHPVRAR